MTQIFNCNRLKKKYVHKIIKKKKKCNTPSGRYICRYLQYISNNKKNDTTISSRAYTKSITLIIRYYYFFLFY